ncbi:DUF4430 domain-containing protein [Clostridium rectalis]|uniref:DUF4430 domain-containing protein n=1 Tax=Clostridium rectalis TaxID=2040295 RepID=UPI000F63FF27|nr:DUF4430 domain-containing protein [Clostridium rectalis]
MKDKKKLIIACTAIFIVFIVGFLFNRYKKSSQVTSNNTRVIQRDDKDTKTIEEKKKEDKKKEDKKKQEKKKEEKNKKEEGKKEEENKTNKSNQKTVAPSTSSKVKDTSNNRTVYIRVEGYDKTFIPRTKVTTGIFDLNPYSGPATGSSATASKGWGVDKFKEPTNAHALVKLLSDKGYKKGVGYDLQDYGWSLYIAMIGGNREFDYRSTSGWMYRVNNVLPSVGCQGRPIKDGDEILWYFGAYGFDTLVTEMSVSAKSVNVGQPITVTLNGIKNDINTWKEFREPAKGATIYVNGSPLKAVTDSNGKATIKFSKKGSYRLSAERINSSNLKDIVRPEPVTVIVK